MNALRHGLASPVGLGIVLATILTIIVARTRFARWSIYASPLLIWLFTAGVWFDGQPVGFFGEPPGLRDWVHCVELRACGGLALALLAAPLGAAVGKLIGVNRGVLLGLAALGPFGTGLFASSALLLTSVAVLRTYPPARAEATLAILRAAILQSDRVLACGTLLSILACVTQAIALLRNRPAMDGWSRRGRGRPLGV
jgi:hypothetical protein